MTATTTTTPERIERLSAISAKRVIEPDVEVPGEVGPGQVLPDDLLSVIDLDLDLSADQRARLSREEVAAIVQAGIHFEAVLTAGFALQITRAPDVRDPAITYLLHEIGEESRHSRIFVRLVEQLDPQGRNPFMQGPLRWFADRGVRLIIRFPALLYTLVLGGEEIPDLLQKLASEHPDTDPFLRQVNRYHRQEEARHLSFARLMLPELWKKAGPIDRIAVKQVAPHVIWGMFDTLVHPGVYASVGLPGWKTWSAVRHSPSRVALRYEATRPVLKALLDGGVLRPGRIPRAWRRLCGVDVSGAPLAA